MISNAQHSCNAKPGFLSDLVAALVNMSAFSSGAHPKVIAEMFDLTADGDGERQERQSDRP